MSIPYRGAEGPFHLLADCTGIKVEGEGEWNARRHSDAKRRVWRKVHLRIDGITREIKAVKFTSSDIGDVPILSEYLDLIPPDQEIGCNTLDVAHDPQMRIVTQKSQTI